jgi:multidrug resistance efflux pump
MKDQAQIRVAEANLARSRAQLKNAQAEAARFEQLSKEGISTRTRPGPNRCRSGRANIKKR